MVTTLNASVSKELVHIDYIMNACKFSNLAASETVVVLDALCHPDPI